MRQNYSLYSKGLGTAVNLRLKYSCTPNIIANSSRKVSDSEQLVPSALPTVYKHVITGGGDRNDQCSVSLIPTHEICYHKDRDDSTLKKHHISLV